MTTTTSTAFEAGQLVRGVNAGTFLVLGLRTVGGEQYAQLKECCPITFRTRAGEICLPVTALRDADHSRV